MPSKMTANRTEPGWCTRTLFRELWLKVPVAASIKQNKVPGCCPGNFDKTSCCPTLQKPPTCCPEGSQLLSRDSSRKTGRKSEPGSDPTGCRVEPTRHGKAGSDTSGCAQGGGELVPSGLATADERTPAGARGADTQASGQPQRASRQPWARVRPAARELADAGRSAGRARVGVGQVRGQPGRGRAGSGRSPGSRAVISNGNYLHNKQELHDDIQGNPAANNDNHKIYADVNRALAPLASHLCPLAATSATADKPPPTTTFATASHHLQLPPSATTSGHGRPPHLPRHASHHPHRSLRRQRYAPLLPLT
ncbi:hypothetical protein IEQ34_008406 [Dendrobium chrysotoxum]|uniref:Uncharacterized protein n=1 Tax=Dendrobium chrysotoxum TaxID=161865 RepID=A0AAV7GVS4_DENCH|nr:hypothetical protein IEQ34_008406 [Dendrobium chrysotoxum]